MGVRGSAARVPEGEVRPRSGLPTRDAGSLLRELWGEGQRMRAEEMLKEVTGSTLEIECR